MPEPAQFVVKVRSFLDNRSGASATLPLRWHSMAMKGLPPPRRPFHAPILEGGPFDGGKDATQSQPFGLILRSADMGLEISLSAKGHALAEEIDRLRQLAIDRRAASLKLFRARHSRLGRDIGTLGSVYQPVQPTPPLVPFPEYRERAPDLRRVAKEPGPSAADRRDNGERTDPSR